MPKTAFKKEPYKYGFSVPENYVFKAKRGLSEDVVKEISWMKKEPSWMHENRLRGLELFYKKPLPHWAGDLTKINFDDIFYYLKPTEKQAKTWNDVPADIKNTFDRLGVPQAERKFLAGLTAQFESEAVYHSIHKNLTAQGVIFTDMDTALKEHPEIVKKYFGTVVPAHDNKIAALNTAVWSGGSFLYVPKGVHVKIPLQAYFRINAKNMGQFERTLIITEEGSSVHYIEGCLPAGEQVSLGDRWVNIESIKPGDIVMNEKGESGKVSAVMTRNYKGKLVKITPLSPYNAFELTEEHPVLCVQREKVLTKRKTHKNWLPEVDSKKLKNTKPEYVPVGKIEKGDFLVFPKIQASGKTKLSSKELQLLGWYLAEGSTFINRALNMPVVSISLGSYETERIKKVKKLLSFVTGKNVYETKDKKKRGVTLSVYSQKLRDFCLLHCGKGSKTKMLSKEIMDLPWKKLKPLFDSYFEGDGSIYRKGRTMKRCTTASRHLAEQIQEILARGGYYATITVRKGGPDVILGRDIHRGDQYIVYYAPKKRWSEVRAVGNYFLVPVKHVKNFYYEGRVFNLEVRGLNSYLVRGFAVHNCTAPVYTTDSLHAAVVELIAMPNSTIRYTTIQNWSNSVYNLVTKRAVAYENATVQWIDANIGSKLTMKYPCVVLAGRGAKGEVLSMAFAGKGQHQDAGAKMIHVAPDTSSIITSKSIAQGGGRTSYRGLVKVLKGAERSKVHVQCDALLIDPISRSDTYPTMEIDEEQVAIAHEASVTKITEDQLFYLRSRGLPETDARAVVVGGFVEQFVKELPMEYAVEMNRLIQMEMEGGVG